MEKKTNTTVIANKETKAKKPINPKNKPVIPAKKPETKATETGANKSPVSKTKKAAPEKQDAKKAMNPPAPTFSEADIARYDELVTTLKDSWSAVQKATMATAFVLYEVYNSGLYRIDGYKNIYEFGSELFGQSKSTLNRLINIVDRFGEQIDCGKPVHSIDDKYSGYSQSQLEAMLGHTDDELKAITPEMSVREIKRILKSDEKKTAKDKPDSNVSSVESDTPEEAPRKEKALLIWGFENVEQWDNLLSTDNEIEYRKMLSTIRKCLQEGHTVRILDVFEVTEA